MAHCKETLSLGSRTDDRKSDLGKQCDELCCSAWPSVSSMRCYPRRPSPPMSTGRASRSPTEQCLGEHGGRSRPGGGATIPETLPPRPLPSPHRYGHLTWEWAAGLRSYVHPALFAAFYWVLRATGADSAWLVAKGPALLQAVAAAVTDLHVYRLTRLLFGEAAGR